MSHNTFLGTLKTTHLRNQGNSLMEVRMRILLNNGPIQCDFSFVTFVKMLQKSNDGRFAWPGRSNYGGGLSGFDLESYFLKEFKEN